MLITVKKKKNYGATLPNFSATFYLHISTYQNNGTSDFMMYFRKLSDGSTIGVQEWRGSTGGSYFPVEEFSLTQFINYMMNYQLIIQFKDQGKAESTWWEPTPILDELTGFETPELLNNVISAQIRGSTLDFYCDDVYGIRKPTTPASTIMTVKVRISTTRGQPYPNDGYVSIYIKNIQGVPETYAVSGGHQTRLVMNSSEVLSGPSYIPVTIKDPILGSNQQKIMSTIRGNTMQVLSYGGTQLKLTSPATDSFRTAAFYSLHTAGTSLGSYVIGNNGTTSYQGQVAIFQSLSFQDPQIYRETFPYLKVRVVLTGNPNMRFTIWNNTYGYLYVNGQRSYENVNFMSDGAGQGYSQITPLTGAIVCVFFEVDQHGFALNAVSIPKYTLQYSVPLNQATTAPNTLVSQELNIPSTLRYQGGPLKMSVHYWYATERDPPDPDDPDAPPEPVPIPPVPNPDPQPVPTQDVTMDDTALRQEKAVEEVKGELQARFLVPIDQRSNVFKEMSEEYKQTGKIQGVDSSEIIRVHQIMQKKEITSDDQVFLDALVARKGGNSWYSPSHFQQTINHYAQIVNELAAMQMFNRNIVTSLAYRGSRSISDLQAILKGASMSHLYPGIMNQNAYISLSMAGHSNINELLSAINRRDHVQIYGKIPKFSEKVSDDTIRNSLKWVQQGIANYDKSGKHNMVSTYGLPYNPFNYTSDLFDMKKHPVPPQFFSVLSTEELEKFVKDKQLPRQPTATARYVSPEASGEYNMLSAAVNTMAVLGAVSPMTAFLANAGLYAYDRVESFSSAYNDPIGSLNSLGIEDLMQLGGYQIMTGLSLRMMDSLFYTAQLGGVPGVGQLAQRAIAGARQLPTVVRQAGGIIKGLASTIAAYDIVYKNVLKPLYVSDDIDKSFKLELNSEQKAVLGAIAGSRFSTKDELAQMGMIAAITTNAIAGTNVVDTESINDLLDSQYGQVAYRMYLITEGLLNPTTRASIGVYAVAKILERLGLVDNAYSTTRNKIFQTATTVANRLTGFNIPMPQFEQGENITPEDVPTLESMSELMQEELMQNIFGVSQITPQNRPYVTGQMANNAFRGALLGIGARLKLQQMTEGVQRAKLLSDAISINDTQTVAEVLRQFGFSEFTPKEEYSIQTLENSMKPPKTYFKQDLTYKMLEMELVRGVNEFAERKAEQQTFHSLLAAMVQQSMFAPIASMIPSTEIPPSNILRDEPFDGTILQRQYDTTLLDSWYDMGQSLGRTAYDAALSVVKIKDGIRERWVDDLRSMLERIPPPVLENLGQVGKQIYNESSGNDTKLAKPLRDVINITNSTVPSQFERFSNATLERMSGVKELFGQNAVGNVTYGEATIGLLAAGILATGGKYVYDSTTSNKTNKTNDTEPQRKRDVKASDKVYQDYSYMNPMRYFHQVKGTKKSDQIDISQPIKDIERDTVVVAAHEAKHINPMDGMKLWAATVVTSLPRNSEYQAVLSDPSISDTSEGRRKTLDAIHKLIHGAQKHTNYESPIVRNGILSALSAYFQAGIRHAQAARNEKSQAFFQILQAILRPQTTEDYNIQKQFASYMHKDLANPIGVASFASDNEIEALHTIGRHPRLLSDFIERVLISSHSFRKSQLGGVYTSDRFRPDYAVPELLKIREKKSKPIVVREPGRTRLPAQPAKKLSYLEGRNASEMSDNRQFNLKKRKL